MPNNESPKPATPEPVSLEKRLPIALALMMLVLLGSQYLFKPAPGPKPVVPVTVKNAAALATKPATTPVQPAADANANPVQASAEELTTVDTDVYHIVFTNRGAAVKSWALKRYPDSNNKPQQLINTNASALPLPFTIELLDQKLSVDPNTVLYETKLSNGGLTLDFQFSDGKATIRKVFRFTRDSYLADVSSSTLQNGQAVPNLLVWRGGFGDQNVRNAAAAQHTVRYDTSAGKLITKVPKDAKNGPITDSGNYTFGGLEDNFFAAVALPPDSQSLEVRTYSDEVKVPGEDKPVPFVGAGLSAGAQNQFSLYVGPKDIDLFRKVNPKLSSLIDWGFFGILAKPLFLALNWVNDHWTNNYGWAIILVTFIINLLLLPLRLSSLKSARKMQGLQPRLQAINAKYKGLAMSDPKKADQNTETMALYKEAGVNPVGGCLPMLVQLPFFYAFYRVLNIAIELRHAPWLWVPDLSQAETLPLHILPIVLVGTQFLSQRLTPAAGIDPNQQRMMMFMPVMFGFMFYPASAGLVLYWLTGNLVGIAQQLVINRFMPSIKPPVVAPTPIPAASKAPVKRTVKK